MSYLKSARSNLFNWKILEKNKTKMPKFGTRKTWFGFFWAGIWKQYCHIEISTLEFIKLQNFAEKLKCPNLGPKMPYKGVFGLESLKHHGSESISFLGPKIWNILPDRLKNVNSIEAFKMQIKKWKPENCPCRFCKVYVQNVGFV